MKEPTWDERCCQACGEVKPRERYRDGWARACVDCDATRQRQCFGCGPRPRSVFASRSDRYCDDCKVVRALMGNRGIGRKCRKCKQRLPLDAFSDGSARYCVECVQENRKRPCVRCHERKAPELFPWGDETPSGRAGFKRKRRKGKFRRRSTVCLDCWAESHRLQAERRSTWTRDDGLRVRRCCECAEVFPLTSEHFYVDGRNSLRNRCRACDRAKQREAYHEMMKDPKRAERTRERTRAAKRRYAARHPDRVRQQQRDRMARLRSDPDVADQLRADARIDRRLRRERLGLAVRTPGARTPGSGLPSVPARPLADAVVRYANSRRVRGVPRSLEDVCAQLGIEPRTLYAWRVGERALAHFDIADAILQATELNWWDVWACHEHDDPVAGCDACTDVRAVIQVFEGESKAA